MMNDLTKDDLSDATPLQTWGHSTRVLVGVPVAVSNYDSWDAEDAAWFDNIREEWGAAIGWAEMPNHAVTEVRLTDGRVVYILMSDRGIRIAEGSAIDASIGRLGPEHHPIVPPGHIVREKE